MGKYAQSTRVPVVRSQLEIKDTLIRYGAESFGFFEKGECATIMFAIDGLGIKIQVPYPDCNDQEIRQRWRALLLVIKAKLEAIDSGISTFETEFLPFILMPDGQTIGQTFLPQIKEAKKLGQMPDILALPLLPAEAS